MTDQPACAGEDSHRALVVGLERVLDRAHEETDSGGGETDEEGGREYGQGSIGVGDDGVEGREERTRREREIQ